MKPPVEVAFAVCHGCTHGARHYTNGKKPGRRRSACVHCIADAIRLAATAEREACIEDLLALAEKYSSGPPYVGGWRTRINALGEAADRIRGRKS